MGLWAQVLGILMAFPIMGAIAVSADELVAWASEHEAAARGEYAARLCGTRKAAEANLAAARQILQRGLAGSARETALAELSSFAQRYETLVQDKAHGLPGSPDDPCDVDLPSGLAVGIVASESAPGAPRLPNWHYVWSYQPPTKSPRGGER